MFVGRDRELQTLENLYQKDSFQMVVLYGRRRVGKTTLISKFIEGKPGIFFAAQEANDRLNLEMFSRQVYRFFEVSRELPPFQDWSRALQFFAEKTGDRQVILAIDEFPYAAGANKGLKSILRNAIDHSLKDTRTFLILCGSQIGFMEDQVLGYQSPLFGRRTAQMKIGGFDYLDAAEMLGPYSNEDKIRFYSCVGGTPYYLSRIEQGLSFEENIAALYFDPAGYLYDEPLMLLKQELRESAVYNSVISAIAAGATKLNDIAAITGEERSKAGKYLDTLIGLGILHKEYPFGEDIGKSRKGIYRISDNCYRFWYRYVFLNKTAIEQGAGEPLFRSLLPELNSFTGFSFEEICFQYMIRLNNRSALPFIFTRSGRWWGTNAHTKTSEEIDLVFSEQRGTQAIFAECKWRNTVTEAPVLEKLIEKSALRAGYDTRYYYLYSKSGFSSGCRALAEKTGNVVLVEAGDLFAAKHTASSNQPAAHSPPPPQPVSRTP
jgi:AAA+ ATPase superfamily predicted ATPase